MHKANRFLFIGLVLVLAASCRTITIDIPVDHVILPPQTGPQWEKTEYDGVYEFFFRDSMKGLSLSVLAFDMNSHRFQIVITEPDPSGRGDTRSLKVSDFVRQYDLIAGINGAPYGPANILNRNLFVCYISGLYLYKGSLISEPYDPFDALYIPDEGEIFFDSQKLYPLDGVSRAVGGFHIALKDGENLGSADARHPRSVIGLSRDSGFLYFAAFDGRQPEYAGVTTQEIGLWMSWLGATDALNMDGGGSTALVLNRHGEPTLLNSPVQRGITGLERSVASHVGIGLSD